MDAATIFKNLAAFIAVIIDMHCHVVFRILDFFVAAVRMSKLEFRYDHPANKIFSCTLNLTLIGHKINTKLRIVFH